MPRERKVIYPEKDWLNRKKVTYIKSDFYCMNCGKQDVWQDENDGEDYYLGHSVECLSCGWHSNCHDRVGD